MVIPVKKKTQVRISKFKTAGFFFTSFSTLSVEKELAQVNVTFFAK